MPEFPFVDAHVHLWEPGNVHMPWIAGNAVLDRTYLLPQFKEHTAEQRLEAFVYLETGVVPHYALYEAAWVVEEVAPQDTRLKGVVAAAPLEYGEAVRSYLKALKKLGPLIKGVRRITQGEVDPAFCLQADFVKGAQLLAEFDLSCDLCINHTQLKTTTELVRRCPGTRFILDHIAKPNIREHVLEPWRAQLTELAALPNVVCKISGAVTEADHVNWSSADFAPYIQHTLNVFGEDRVLFGSDWPVVLLASTYERWVRTVDELTAPLSAAARRKLWNENAVQTYRLK